MEYEFDYQFLKHTGKPNVSLLKNNDSYGVDGITFLPDEKYTDIKEPVYLALNPPISPEPNLNANYLRLSSAVFSQKIAAVLPPLKIKGYQLLPAIAVDNKGGKHHNFWIKNVYTCLECFDKEKSEYDICPFYKVR